jgi:MoaA/NifB/PqqE/SkfB family radical SAM enzyme
MTEHSWGQDRILSFLKEGRELYTALYKGNASVAIPAPRFISCWVSEICNLDCTYCFFSDTNHEKSHQYIDTNRFLAWLSQAKAAGAEALEFSGGGEPTLHPKFEEIFTRARAMGYQLGLITHACNPMPLEAIVKNFKYIRCGLDAATTETHDKIKRNKREKYWFPKAIENIRELVRLRDIKTENDFTVGIKIVLNSINVHEINDMIDLAQKLEVDYIQIKREHSSDNDIPVSDF